MPDDELFPKGEEEGKPGEKAPAGPDLTTQVTDAANKAFGPLFQQIGQTVGQINQRMDSMEKAGAPEEPQLKDEDSKFGNAKVDALLEDPEEFVRKLAAEQTVGTTGPLFQSLLADKQRAVLRDMKAETDTKFGDGIWDSEFASEVGAVLDSFPVQLKSSEGHIRSAVQGVMGSKIDMLLEAGNKTAAAQKKEIDSRQNTGDYSPLGPGRAPPVAGKLSPDDKEFIKYIKDRDDPEYSEAQHIQSMTRGNTEDDWPREEKKSGT